MRSITSAIAVNSSCGTSLSWHETPTKPPLQEQDVPAFIQLRTGYTGLKQILDFLGPLRIAGRADTRNLTDEHSIAYVQDDDRKVAGRGELFDEISGANFNV